MKTKRARRHHSDEYKAKVVARVQAGERVGAVATDEGLAESLVRYWMKDAGVRTAVAPNASQAFAMIEHVPKKNGQLAKEIDRLTGQLRTVCRTERVLVSRIAILMAQQLADQFTSEAHTAE